MNQFPDFALCRASLARMSPIEQQAFPQSSSVRSGRPASSGNGMWVEWAFMERVRMRDMLWVKARSFAVSLSLDKRLPNSTSTTAIWKPVIPDPFGHPAQSRPSPIKQGVGPTTLHHQRGRETEPDSPGGNSLDGSRI